MAISWGVNPLHSCVVQVVGAISSAFRTASQAPLALDDQWPYLLQSVGSTIALVRGKNDREPHFSIYFDIFRMFRPLNINPQSPMGSYHVLVCFDHRRQPSHLWPSVLRNTWLVQFQAFAIWRQLRRPRGLTYDFCLGAAAEHAREPESR